MNNINNLMEAVNLEMAIKDLDKFMDKMLNDLDIHLVFIEAKYAGDKLRDMELINDLHDWMNRLLKLVNKFKDIEFNAIKINDLEIYWKCEKRITKIVEVMEYVRNKYMF